MGGDGIAPGSGSGGGILTVAAAGSGLVAVGSMWLPWFWSGNASRNSFGFFRAAQVLGIEWVTPFRVGWFLLPVLLLVALALLGFGARRSGIAGLVVLGLVLAPAGGLSWVGMGPASGSAASTIAGSCCMVLAVLALRGGCQRREPREQGEAAVGRSRRQSRAAS